jgi:hypothetical protein
VAWVSAEGFLLVCGGIVYAELVWYALVCGELVLFQEGSKV